MCCQARYYYKQSLLDQAIAFIGSTSWDIPRSKDKEVDYLPNPSNNSFLV